MVQVIVYNDDLQRALRVLKKKVQHELRLYKEKQSYEKPSDRRRRRRSASINRAKRDKEKREKNQ